MIGGYTGKLLRIDLTRRQTAVEDIDLKLARQFIGGRGYGAKLLFDELKPFTDPLSPENKIIYATGPVTGTPVLGANRYVVVTKSPETGLFLDSYSGGCFAPEMKFAGYDFMIIEGKSSAPVSLWIKDDRIEFHDAAHLWGKNAWDAETQLKKDVGDPTARVSVIGPAGEKLSNLALIQNEYYHQCGRGGAGAVMGSKNLKAIVVRGSRSIRIADPKKVMAMLRETIDRTDTMKPAVARMKYGSPLTLDSTNLFGILPTLNYKYGQFTGASQIDSVAFRKKVVRDTSCFGCTIGCTKVTRIEAGEHAGDEMGGPEYETNALLGSNLGIANMDEVIYLNMLCDSLGMDTIGVGNVIGWAIECCERGILSDSDVDGMDLKFGNVPVIAALITKIAYRRGIGDLLAKGVKQAAREVGKGSEEFAMHVKGLEYPAYRPGPASPGFGLAYAVSERGACHRRAWPTIEEQMLEPNSGKGRAALVKRLYDQRVPWHCALTCDFPVLFRGAQIPEAAQTLTAVTGWDLTTTDMQDLCDRVATLLKVFNLREGATEVDDTLAPRSFQPDETGMNRGKALTREMLLEMRQEYYTLRGWDKAGVPTPSTLHKLGLSDLI
ncbi:MAG: aldehyde ferredoxin oxidoreductase family protein [Dehalococcoidales bacterium]|nr:aldehyde ferredoxin oxidoreductase family protein [Dehalococcoidales bacterium]